MKISKRYLIAVTAILSLLLIFASCGVKDGDTHFSETYDSLDELLEANVKRLAEEKGKSENNADNESEILAFLDMTFGEIMNAGYELNYLYSYQGPGTPVYELGSETGVLLMFSAEEADEYKVQSDSMPYRIIVNNPNIELFGLKIGMLPEEENKVISEWDYSGRDFLHTGVYYTKKNIDNYSVTALREATVEDLKLFCSKNNITFSEEDYESDFVQYEIIPMFAEKERVNPCSHIISLKIEKNKKGENEREMNVYHE